MILFPAIDLYNGKAVRLYKGDYNQMTIYSDHPEEIGKEFINNGASHIHIVDLEGAKDGTAPNFETVVKIKETTGAFCEIGGGIRTLDVLEKYFSVGIDRAILGTAAVTDEAFLKDSLDRFGDKIAVGADIKDKKVCIKGWLETSDQDVYGFFNKMQTLGVKTIICTDISKDGAMTGTNRELYHELGDLFPINITASGGVSTLEDILYLNELDIYGAIIGKAYYTGAIDLAKAVEAVK